MARRSYPSPNARSRGASDRLAQADADVVLDGLHDRPVGLAKGAIAGFRGAGERAAERAHHELVRLCVEGEGRRLARAAHDAAGGAREPGEVVGLAARGARRQLRREARGEQELEAEGELV